MKINADFNKRVVVHSANMEWVKSPMPGVSRKPLDRVGDEVARATSIVRYAEGSHFSAHVHTGGEEFFVLEGVFQDQHGDYPPGSYIRNPPKSSHKPRAEEGCIIFVKLWQFNPEDRNHVVLNTHLMLTTELKDQASISVMSLYHDKYESVFVYHVDADTNFTLDANEGLEMLVLNGSVTESGDTLNQYSWLRLPLASKLNARSGNDGVELWVKHNHLACVNEQIERINAANA